MGLEQLEQAAEQSAEGWRQHVRTVDSVLLNLRAISLGPAAERHLLNGQAVTIASPPADVKYLESFRAYNQKGQFLALVQNDNSANPWKPVKVFHLPSPSPYAPSSLISTEP